MRDDNNSTQRAIRETLLRRLEYVDIVEDARHCSGEELFGATPANVQPHSVRKRT